MGVGFWYRKRGAPILRDVLERPRTNFLQHARIDSDIGNTDVTAIDPARQQQMPRLAPEERHGFGGTDRDAHDGAGVAIDAAREVNAEHRRAVLVDGLDHLVRLSL